MDLILTGVVPPTSLPLASWCCVCCYTWRPVRKIFFGTTFYGIMNFLLDTRVLPLLTYYGVAYERGQVERQCWTWHWHPGLARYICFAPVIILIVLIYECASVRVTSLMHRSDCEKVFFALSFPDLCRRHRPCATQQS